MPLEWLGVLRNPERLNVSVNCRTMVERFMKGKWIWLGPVSTLVRNVELVYAF